jgi:hypothetical protein
VVADAVAVEPVSASEFPANREKNREFRQFCPLTAIFASNSIGKFNHLQQNSLRNETGNLSEDNTELNLSNREFVTKQGI